MAVIGCSANTVTPSTPDATADGPDGSVVAHDDAAMGGSPDASTGNDDAAVIVTGPARSDKARVHFKGQTILASQMAQALGLPAAQVYQELGRYDAFTVHRIALGGVEPYTLGINDPFPDTSATGPLAIERIALGGCKGRVDADLGTPASAVIFTGIGPDTLADINAAEPRQAIDKLYARFLSRRASDAEARVLLDLYADVTAANEPRPARAWAILSCFAVATSLEALFY